MLKLGMHLNNKMTTEGITEKGVLARLVEKGLKILLKKECKKIGKIKIDIFASSIQIIKGIIQKLHVIAEDINYKDLLFDAIELEANEVKIFFRINNKELNFKNNFIIKFRISLSEKSLRTILSSDAWRWIGDMISNEIFNQAKLEEINIKNDKILIKNSKEINAINEENILNLKAAKGKMYLENKAYKKSIKIPIEDKVFIKSVTIKNNKCIRLMFFI